MQKRSKRSSDSRAFLEAAPDDAGTMRVVRGILSYLNENQGDRGEGVHALLIAYVQAALQVLDDSSAEHIDTNREALTTMLDQARRIVGARSLGPAADRWTVH